MCFGYHERLGNVVSVNTHRVCTQNFLSVQLEYHSEHAMSSWMLRTVQNSEFRDIHHLKTIAHPKLTETEGKLRHKER